MNPEVEFNVRRSPIWYHLRLWHQIQSNMYYWFIYCLEVAGFTLIAILLVNQIFSFGLDPTTKAISAVFAGIMIPVTMIDWFWRGYFVKNDERVAAFATVWSRSHNKINLANYCSFQAAALIADAAVIAKKAKRESVSPEDILAAGSRYNAFRTIVTRLGLTDWIVNTPGAFGFVEVKLSNEAMRLVETAYNYAISQDRQLILVSDLVVGIAEVSPVAKQSLKNYQIEQKDLLAVVAWQERWAKLLKQKAFWEVPEYGGGIGRDWAAGYARDLHQYAIDLSQFFSADLNLNVIGHQAEISAIERILGRSKQHNVLLVGEPGIGKKTIVNGFAQRVMLGATLPVLRYRHIFQLDLNRLLAGAGAKGELERRLVAVMDDAMGTGNVILFIDGLERLAATTEAGGIDASELLLPYLRGTSIQIIATTTPEDFHSTIETNSGFSSAFERVDVKEPSKEETIFILEEALPLIENMNQVIITYPSLSEVVRLADRYIKDKPFPVKAIQLMDEISVAGAARGIRLIEPAFCDEIAQVQLKVPLGEVKGEEKTKLLDLDKLLHERVIGQDVAIQTVANAMRRARAGLGSEKRPIGTFLFVGPTGVGKTETAKALAQAYFGSEKRMIRIDMSEYKDQGSIARLIGGQRVGRGLPPSGLLTQAVIDQPFSLILLDEFEKANPDIINLFLQVFDDGRLTDSAGRVIDFTNTIIIATSNAGAEFIRQKIKAGPLPPDFQKELIDYIQTQGIFRPELINRFDSVVFYLPVSLPDLEKIVSLKVSEINGYLKGKNIQITLTEPAIKKLAQAGYSPEFGARPLRRVLQDKVENIIARGLLEGTIQPNTTITITPEMV